jgi:hypothetical protein
MTAGYGRVLDDPCTFILIIEHSARTNKRHLSHSIAQFRYFLASSLRLSEGLRDSVLKPLP